MLEQQQRTPKPTGIPSLLQDELFPIEIAELKHHPEFCDAWSAANATLGYTWDNERNEMNKVDTGSVLHM